MGGRHMRDFPYSVDGNGSTKGFVGLGEVKRQQAKTLEDFRKWVNDGDFGTLHSSHFDWWMFPIDERSSRGAAYILSPADAQRVATDAAFISDIREGVRLLLFSWGWDITTASPIPHPAPSQRWTGYSVRLFKAGRCMQTLNQPDYFAALLKFARYHHHQGDKLVFSSGNHSRGHCLDLWAQYVRPRWPGEEEA
eukprot:TRINITY_DN26493_c0_g1_i1.p1 TRINITY_DN26493_c0_g1~~TRINITY_DN26493_c0_g1_i1.p1  ORF type:complete len:213 (+),score=25.63 TRINITY_DN26493_c0_g1_i1:60-641(+)